MARLTLVKGRKAVVHPLDVRKDAAVQLAALYEVLEDVARDLDVDTELARERDGRFADR